MAFVTLIFSENVAFQLAAALVLLFLSYAGSVRHRPFMSADEHPAVVREHLALSLTDPLHSRLRATLAAVEATGRKRTTGFNLADGEKGTDGLSQFERFAKSALNYNNVDAFMLFSGTAILLCGILFVSVRPTDSFYARSNLAVLAVAMLIVVVTIAYWFFAVIVDVSAQVRSKGRGGKMTVAAACGCGKRGGGKLTGGPAARAAAPGAADDAPLGDRIFTVGLDKDDRETTASNPLFATATGEAIVTGDQVMGALRTMREPPSHSVWTLIREQLIARETQSAELSAANAELKNEVGRLNAVMEAAGLSAGKAAGRAAVAGGAPSRKEFASGPAVKVGASSAEKAGSLAAYKISNPLHAVGAGRGNL